MNDLVKKEESKFDLSLNRKEFREIVTELQEKIESLPEALIGDTEEYLKVCPLKHTFVDGAYVREIFLPKGMLFVTKIHAKTHPYFVMRGCASVLTEEGIVQITAPFAGITKAGTKRVIYTHEDTVWITVHATNETDLAKIEEEIIAKTFDDMDNVIELQEFIREVKE